MFFHLTKDQAALLMEHKGGEVFEDYTEGLRGQKIRALDSLVLRGLCQQKKPATGWKSKYALTKQGKAIGQVLFDLIASGKIKGLS